jgi:hypothetical protein
MPSPEQKLFEREEEIELWRSIGIKPHIMIADKSFHDFIETIAFLLNCWLQKAGAKGLKLTVMAERLQRAGILAHPGHRWDGDSVQRVLELDRQLRGLPKPLLKPRKRRRFRYARSSRPPRVTQAELKNRASVAWFEEIADLDTISSPYFREKLLKLRGQV